MRFTYLLLLSAGIAVPALVQAQRPEKRPLTQEDFDRWRSIVRPALSPDGKWVAYTLAPQVGDGELVLRATGAETEYRYPRGFVGRPEMRPAADSGFTAPAAQWTADSRWIVYTIFPPQDSMRTPSRGRGRPAEAPVNALGLVAAGSGEVTVLPRVRSFRLARSDGRYLAYLREPDRPSPAPGDSASGSRGRRPSETGSTLVLRDLATGAEVEIPFVRSYLLSDSGSVLAYTVAASDRTTNGAFLRNLLSGETTPLRTGAGTYGQIAVDRSGRRVAFLATDDARDSTAVAAYLATVGKTAVVTAIATADSAGPGMKLADRGRLAFVEDGAALEVPLAPVLPDSIPADSLADKAILDLWHWRDPRLQPQQQIEARRDRQATYTGLYQPALRRFFPLGNPALPRVTVARTGRTALGVTTEPYRIEAMWGEGGSDVYALNGETGARTLVARRVPFDAQLSPQGRYVVWFAGGQWWSHATATGTTVSLTGALPDVRFDQETWDTPSETAPWGIGGWVEGERALLLYDRYDLWEVDPAGRRPARMVTDSAGRRARTVLRVADLDREDPYVSATEPLVLRAFQEETKESGFWTDRLDGTEPPAVVAMSAHRWEVTAKATHGTTFLATRSTFQEFPDLWAGDRLDALTKISDANPQQAEVKWGEARLVSWRSEDGVPLQGILYTPEDFDSLTQYPMVVYFYEQLSDGLHNYVMTYPRNTIQPTWYVSNGYLVFFPDIAYGTGYPGPDALKAIVPGVQSLVRRGFVKPDGIGIAGQSWGGYQTAFIITRTNLFKAAMTGAPVANMTSAYGGIRWQSGLARAFQYEHTQSRIGGSLWEYPLRYLENSPLFAADRIETPLLIMHNDNDGAVPWYQGIELFVALRRHQKEVYLVDYNGEAHNPTKRANQADIARRTMQFFDHHLRGAPAPSWMTEGIPYLRKGRDQLPPPVPTAPVATGSP